MSNSDYSFKWDYISVPYDENRVSQEVYCSNSNNQTSCIKFVIGAALMVYELIAPQPMFADCSIEYSDVLHTTIDNTIIGDNDNRITQREIIRWKLEEEVRELSKLGDNWDGYGASRVSSHSVVNVMSLLELNEIGIEKISDIYANVNGFLSIEWENEDKDIVSLEVGRKKMGYYTTFGGKSEFFDKLDICERSIVELTRNIARL